MRSLDGVWLALAAALLFGVSGVVAADVFDTVDPARVAQYRSVLTAVVLLSVAAHRRKLAARGSYPLLALLGLFLAGVTITFYWAIDRLGVGPGVTIQFLGPVLVLGWMRRVQGRPVPAAAWAASAAAVTGTLLITRAWTGEVDLVGVAAGLAAAVTFAGYLIVGELLGGRLAGLTVTAWGFTFSAIVWLLVLPPRIVDVDGGDWASLIWVAIAGTAIPFLLEVGALRRADPGRVGVAATGEPVVAAITAWIVLGQALSPVQLVGGALVVAGIATIQVVTSSVAPDTPPAAV